MASDPNFGPTVGGACHVPHVIEMPLHLAEQIGALLEREIDKLTVAMKHVQKAKPRG